MDMVSMFDSMLVGNDVQLGDGRTGFVICAGLTWVVYTDGEHIYRMARAQYNEIVLASEKAKREREGNAPT